MSALDLIMKAWPLLLGVITLIIVLSKLDLRVAVVEEKLKAIFDLINKRK